MSNRVDCPYCGAEYRIDECPGEDGEVEIECSTCERNYVAVCRIDVSYDARCCDEEHEWGEPDAGSGLVCCKRCDAFTRVPNVGVWQG